MATVFSLFPWTRELAGILANYGLDPVRALGRGFLKQIPNLLFIAVLCILAYFAMRLLRWFFDRLGEREIAVSWIDPEWAPSYYRIFRTVILIGVAVIVFPYIPGSSTPAFKGISIFLGALATFGSSTAISNLVNGLVLMTMRPYHSGDWVRVGDTEGEVLEVEESSVQRGPIPLMAANRVAMAESSKGTTISAGELELTGSVSVSFAIR